MDRTAQKPRILYIAAIMGVLVSSAYLPLASAQSAGTTVSDVSSLQSSLCGIISTIASVIGILAIFMFVVGGILYGVAHLLPAAGNLKGSTQGWGMGMLIGGVIAIVLYLLSSFIIYRLASFSTSGPIPAISQVSCTGSLLSGSFGRPIAAVTSGAASILSAGNYDVQPSTVSSTNTAQGGYTAPGGSTAGGTAVYSNDYCKPTASNVSIGNGDFGSGSYSQWATGGTGFGSGPTDLFIANENAAYYKTPWSNYDGEFFATTYTQNSSYSPGNITSDSFMVTEPFLNFRIVSPQSSLLSVQILLGNAPLIVSYYNTTNGQGSYPLGTFANASINLSPLFCRNVSVRIVSMASTKNAGQEDFIAVGDFYLSNQSISTPGILLNSTVT